MAKKRANGEGNIRKRSDGRWEGRYTAGYNAETGKRIIKKSVLRPEAKTGEQRLISYSQKRNGYK